MKKTTVFLALIFSGAFTLSAQWYKDEPKSTRFRDIYGLDLGGDIGVEDSLMIGYLYSSNAWQTVFDSTGYITKYAGASIPEDYVLLGIGGKFTPSPLTTAMITGLDEKEIVFGSHAGGFQQSDSLYYDTDFGALFLTGGAYATAFLDGSNYAWYRYNDIGLQNASYASSFTAQGIYTNDAEHRYLTITPNTAAWDGWTRITGYPSDTQVDWILPEDNVDGWFKNDGSGNLSWESLTGADITGFPAGRVVYTGSGGDLTTHSRFLFDESDYTFAIGSINTENYNLSVTDTSGRFEGVMTGFGAETLFKLRYANGDVTTPTAVLSGDAMGVFGFAGHDGTAYTSDVDGGIKMIAGENWSGTAHGNYMIFAVKANGSNTLSKMMRLDATGLNIGAFGSHTYTLDVAGDANLTSGHVYRINGSQISASNLSNGITGTAGTNIVLATSPTITTPAVSGNMTISGKVTSYNGLTTAGQGLAVCVGTPVARTAQSASIAATTMHTAPADGIYLVCWTATVTQAASSGSTIGPFHIRYTDPNDSNVKTYPTSAINYVNQTNANTTGAAIGGSFTVYAKSGTDLQYIMGYSSAGGTPMQYDLNINIVRIQ